MLRMHAGPHEASSVWKVIVCQWPSGSFWLMILPMPGFLSLGLIWSSGTKSFPTTGFLARSATSFSTVPLELRVLVRHVSPLSVIHVFTWLEKSSRLGVDFDFSHRSKAESIALRAVLRGVKTLRFVPVFHCSNVIIGTPEWLESLGHWPHVRHHRQHEMRRRLRRAVHLDRRRLVVRSLRLEDV